MPIAKCGIQFSWDTPTLCKGDDDEKCKNCPLNEKYYKTTVEYNKTTVFDEQN